MWDVFKPAFLGPPFEFLADHGHLPLSHAFRQLRIPNYGLPGSDCASLEQIEADQFIDRLDFGMESPAPGGKETRPPEFQFYGWPHAMNQRHEALGQEIEGRRHRVVRSSFQRQR